MSGTVRLLFCSGCGQMWERPKQPGRPPKTCPDCRQVKGAVRLEARSVPTMEGGVAVAQEPRGACIACDGHDCVCGGVS